MAIGRTFPFWPLAAAIGIVLLYLPLLPELVGDWWNDPNYSHGFLIPLVSGYLCWERRDTLRRLPLGSDRGGLLLLVGGLFLFLAGVVAAEEFTQRFSLIVVLAGVIRYNLGRAVFREVRFPLAYLAFMIPLPYLLYDQIAFPLKLFAARCATFSLHLLGIPVFREGNIIELAAMRLEVADACSGIRSLISLFALSVIYAYLSQPETWKRIVLVVATIPIAIVANGARVSGTGIIAEYAGIEAAEGFFHSFSGWLIFVVATLLLVGLGKLLASVGGGKKGESAV
ncbi:MAG: exosortase [Deltaproteobacteria bacterium]|nr:MAG: exosortase [Deltaproteobacteria bacterium]